MKDDSRFDLSNEKDEVSETEQDPVGLLGTEDFLCPLFLVFRE